MSVWRAAHINNTAVAYLQAGRLVEAGDQLKKSVAQVKQIFRCETVSAGNPDLSHRHPSSASTTAQAAALVPPPPSVPESFPGHHFYDGTGLKLLESIPALESRSCLSDAEEIHVTMRDNVDSMIRSVAILDEGIIRSLSISHGTFLEVYLHPFVIESITTTPQTDLQLLAAAVVFNLGLVHHLRGICTGHSKYLLSAAKFYQMALSILRRSESDAAESGLLELALWNNCAHINALLLRVSETRDLLAQLRLSLITVAESMPLSEDYFNFFFMNILFQEGEELHVAPAA